MSFRWDRVPGNSLCRPEYLHCTFLNPARFRVLRNYIDRIPIGYSEGVYRGRRYGITKSAFNENRSFKVYAEQLGGNDFVSLNYYVKRAEDALRPCQMAADKVIDFLKNVELQ